MAPSLTLELVQTYYGRMEQPEKHAQVELVEDEFLTQLEELAHVIPGKSNQYLLDLYQDLYALVSEIPVDHDLPSPNEVTR